MHILGGFDGTRRNDMYKIPLPEQLPREEKRRRRFPGVCGDEDAAEPEGNDANDAENRETTSETSRLRLQVNLVFRLRAALHLLWLYLRTPVVADT